jgi:hypothetical protein
LPAYVVHKNSKKNIKLPPARLKRTKVAEAHGYQWTTEQFYIKFMIIYIYIFIKKKNFGAGCGPPEPTSSSAPAER